MYGLILVFSLSMKNFLAAKVPPLSHPTNTPQEKMIKISQVKLVITRFFATVAGILLFRATPKEACSQGSRMLCGSFSVLG